MSLAWKLAIGTLLVLGLLTARSYAQTPLNPSGTFTATDYALAGGVAASHLLDWASTEECIRRPYAQCHEAQLPNALVHNKVGFAAYETTTAAAETFGQYELTRLGHRKLARFVQSLNITVSFAVVAHNYRLDTSR